jgi:predicted ATPase
MPVLRAVPGVVAGSRLAWRGAEDYRFVVQAAPYSQRVTLVETRVESWDELPFRLPTVRGLDLELRSAVTFFVGENGSGRSTLLESIASLAGLPASGGSRNELGARTGPDDGARLARAPRPSFRKKPRSAHFFRAEATRAKRAATNRGA